jgi:hypothetical protein
MSNYKENKFSHNVNDITLHTVTHFQCILLSAYHIKNISKEVSVLNEIKTQSTPAIQRVMCLKNPMNSEMMI